MTPLEKRIAKLETSPSRTAPRFIVVRMRYSNGYMTGRFTDTLLGLSEDFDPYASDATIDRLVADRGRPQ